MSSFNVSDRAEAELSPLYMLYEDEECAAAPMPAVLSQGEEQITRPSPFDLLDEEILTAILLLLGGPDFLSASKVCRRWRRILERGVVPSHSYHGPRGRYRCSNDRRRYGYGRGDTETEHLRKRNVPLPPGVSLELLGRYAFSLHTPIHKSNGVRFIKSVLCCGNVDKAEEVARLLAYYATPAHVCIVGDYELFSYLFAITLQTHKLSRMMLWGFVDGRLRNRGGEPAFSRYIQNSLPTFPNSYRCGYCFGWDDQYWHPSLGKHEGDPKREIVCNALAEKYVNWSKGLSSYQSIWVSVIGNYNGAQTPTKIQDPHRAWLGEKCLRWIGSAFSAEVASGEMELVNSAYEAGVLSASAILDSISLYGEDITAGYEKIADYVLEYLREEHCGRLVCCLVRRGMIRLLRVVFEMVDDEPDDSLTGDCITSRILVSRVVMDELIYIKESHLDDGEDSKAVARRLPGDVKVTEIVHLFFELCAVGENIAAREEGVLKLLLPLNGQWCEWRDTENLKELFYGSELWNA